MQTKNMHTAVSQDIFDTHKTLARPDNKLNCGYKWNFNNESTGDESDNSQQNDSVPALKKASAMINL